MADLTDPLPVFAMSLGRGVRLPGVELRVVVAAGFSGTLAGAAGVVAFVVRNFWLTLMALKAMGFLTVDELRGLSSLLLVASLSDPPLTLTSAEVTTSFAMSEMCLFSISSVAAGGVALSPVSCDWSSGAFCASGASILIVW